jgi:hypothetical protein
MSCSMPGSVAQGALIYVKVGAIAPFMPLPG